MAKPKFRQMEEFFRQVGAGRITDKVFQVFLDSLSVVFRVIVDYSRSLKEMIQAGNYDWVNSDINDDHFPIKGEGKVETDTTLFHHGKDASIETILAEMDKQGLRPATLPELLAFGEADPEEQRKYPIIALGSVWQRPRGRRLVAYLDEGDSERELLLSWYEDVGGASCRFLAVRK